MSLQVDRNSRRITMAKTLSLLLLAFVFVPMFAVIGFRVGAPSTTTTTSSPTPLFSSTPSPVSASTEVEEFLETVKELLPSREDLLIFYDRSFVYLTSLWSFVIFIVFTHILFALFLIFCN